MQSIKLVLSFVLKALYSHESQITFFAFQKYILFYEFYYTDENQQNYTIANHQRNWLNILLFGKMILNQFHRNFPLVTFVIIDFELEFLKFINPYNISNYLNENL